MSNPDSPQSVPERIAASVRSQFDSEDSRRTFLRRTAAAGGGLLVLGTGSALAQQDEEETGGQTGTEEMFDDQPNTDLDVLNYVLTVKRLQRDLYSQGLEQFSEADFDGEQDDGTTAPDDEEDDDGTLLPDDDDGNETTQPDDGNETTQPDDGNETTQPGGEDGTATPGGDTTAPQDDGTTTDGQQEIQTEGLYATLEDFSSQKEAHVSVIEQTVQLLSGQGLTELAPDDQQPMPGDTEPEQEPTYEFEFTSVDDFLTTAAEIENTVVGAHAGVVGYVDSFDLQSVILSIYSVDARHAGVVNGAAGEQVAPDAFDQPLSQSEVEETVSEFTPDGALPGEGTEPGDGDDGIGDDGIGDDGNGNETDGGGIGDDDGTGGNETDGGGVGDNGNETDDGNVTG